MNGVIGREPAVEGYTRLWTTWSNMMNLGLNHAPGAGLMAWPVDLQSSMLPLCYGCPQKMSMNMSWQILLYILLCFILTLLVLTTPSILVLHLKVLLVAIKMTHNKQGYTGPGIIFANMMNFNKNHVLGAGSIASYTCWSAVQHLCHGCPLLCFKDSHVLFQCDWAARGQTVSDAASYSRGSKCPIRSSPGCTETHGP